MKPAIFKDPELQRKFDEDGYVVMDFITAEEAKLIAQKFYSIHKDQIPIGFFSEAFNPDDSVKRDIYSFTDSIFSPKVESVFKNFKKLGSTFLSKSPGLEGKVGVHQDWSVVDEEKYYSATIWVPTIDTTEENGALMVLPGSQHFFKAYRSNHIPLAYEGSQQLLWDAMITVPMKAGQAFILNHAVIHASNVNQSNQERLSIAYGLMPQEAELCYYHQLAPGKVEKFKMPDDFFQRYYNVGQRPLFGEVVEIMDYDVKAESSLSIQHKINREIERRLKLPIFKDKDAQQFFETNGYLKLPLLSNLEVEELMRFYEAEKFEDKNGFGFHISMDLEDKSHAKKILDKLFEIGVPKLMTHLQNAQVFVGSFVLKEPNPKSVVPVHQDWSFVGNENEHSSITCWIPLVDVNIDNGAIGVIKGSHQYFKNERPSPSPQVPSPIAQYMFQIFPYLQTIEMKAGEVLFFDNRTFHGSPPNTTDKTRVAFGLGIAHDAAQLIHYNLKNDGQKKTIYSYKVDKDFFLKYNNSALSKMYDEQKNIVDYVLENEKPYELPKFTESELVALIKSTGNEMNMQMCEKLATLFSYNLDGTPKEEVKTEESEAKASVQALETTTGWKDDRTFFEKYTPLNILHEVKKRVFA